ncbi:arylsulfotransferase family protein [Streptomyces sp. 4N509B]|uniref:arylsulfotransferase family protein n=1 Tax=Streptomyces sp. 4N509B TaxID=3457413 RepID=UPI003FD36F22
MRPLRTRVPVRSCVAAAAGAALIVPLASAAGAAERHPSPPAVVPLAALDPDAYVTLDASLQAPELTTTTSGREDPGLLLTTPGFLDTAPAVIYDNTGQVVWQRDGVHLNFEQVTFRGRPALALFDSTRGAHVVLDESYTEVATLQLRGGPATDGHDIAFSPDGSRVLLQGWVETEIDLSPWGGPADATVLDTVIQEQDVETGEVTFEWNALDHVAPDETQEPLGSRDLFHANSLAYDTDGDILTSFRHTSTVYRIDTGSGRIVWRFGGEQSDVTFEGGAGDMPSYQHDAQRLPDGSLSVFDNGATHSPRESRGAVYTLDESSMTATLTRELRADPPAFTQIMGSNRRVAGGNQLVSYGTTGRMVEFADGQEVFSARFGPYVSTYRAERTTDWTGTPATAPAVVVGDAAGDGTRAVNVSWNGATEVADWRIQAGPDRGRLTTLGTVPRTGLETAAEVTVPEDADVLRVTALDEHGRALASRTLSTTT